MRAPIVTLGLLASMGPKDTMPRAILFDRFRPQGGDIWMMEGFE